MLPLKSKQRALSFFVLISTLLVGLSVPAYSADPPGYMLMSQATANPKLAADETVGFQICLKCHVAEAKVWQSTWHHTSFSEMHRQPEAKQIAKRLGLNSIKYSQRCNQCHYTETIENGQPTISSAVSCECCHGAGEDWAQTHFPPKTQIGLESPEQKAQRVTRNLSNGMRNRHNTFTMARICMRCHNVADEELVNVGGHSIGDPAFEMVSWSQGRMRHRFVSGKGLTNAENTPKRLAMMFVSGMIADLEFSLRATGKATSNGNFGRQVARRAATSAKRLSSVYKKSPLPILREILEIYSSVDLKANNSEQLISAAEQIRECGVRFGAESTGAELAAISAYVPTKERWIYDP